MNPRQLRTVRWVGGAVFCAGVIFGGSLVASAADHLPVWACVFIFAVAAVVVATWDLWAIVLDDDTRPVNVADLIGSGHQRAGRPSGEVSCQHVHPRPHLRAVTRPRTPLFDAVADDPRLADTMGELA